MYPTFLGEDEDSPVYELYKTRRMAIETASLYADNVRIARVRITEVTK